MWRQSASYAVNVMMHCGIAHDVEAEALPEPADAVGAERLEGVAEARVPELAAAVELRRARSPRAGR